MSFKEKVVDHLKSNGIGVIKVEQDGDNESIVCHILESDNDIIESIKHEMEKEFDVTVVQNDMNNMNVVIVESNNLED